MPKTLDRDGTTPYDKLDKLILEGMKKLHMTQTFVRIKIAKDGTETRTEETGMKASFDLFNDNVKFGRELINVHL